MRIERLGIFGMRVLRDWGDMIVVTLMERLRPLVGLTSWDYCILWKLSEDQRVLEWLDCCCAGAASVREHGGEELLFSVSPGLPCRDALFQHSRTKPCDLLAQLPSSIPLHSGIYAEALLSSKPSWLNFSTNSDSSAQDETVGTRVMIPVPGGLIELFVSKQVSEDQQVVDFAMDQCNISLEQDAMIDSSNMEANFSSIDVDPMAELQSKAFPWDGNHPCKDPSNHVSPATPAPENLSIPYDINVDRIRLCSSPMNFLHQMSFPSEENPSKSNNLFLDGTDDSFLSHNKQIDPFKSSDGENGFHQQDMDALQKCMNLQNVEPLVNTEEYINDHHKDSTKTETGRTDSISDCSDQIDDEDDARYRRRGGKGPSKNLEAERKRRKKLNDRLYILRSLVPKISKLDRASILGDAIEYVKELQKQVKDLHNELEEHSDDEAANNSTLQSEISNPNGISAKSEHEKAPKRFYSEPIGTGSANPAKHGHHDSEITSEKAQQMEPQVEVAQIGGNEFFVKILCEHKPGGFVRLMEALSSLGLEVTNANVTRFLSLTSNVFKLEKRDSEMVQADHVRESLLELTRNPSGEWAEMARAEENGADCHHHHHHHRHNYNHNIKAHHHQLHQLHH